MTLPQVALLVALVLTTAGRAAAQAPTTPEEFARRHFDSGQEFLRSGKFTEALKDFQTVIDSYPGTTVADDAQLAVARYQLEVAGDPAAALATAESLLKKFPASDSVPMAYVVAGQARVGQGLAPANVEAALASFERVPRLFPGTDAVAPALFAAGDTLRQLGRCAEAIERLDQVALEYPRTTWAAAARLSGAACLAAMGRPFDGMESLQRVIVAFPDSPQAAQARRWNTILYRLYVRPPAQQAPYGFANRTVAGIGGKLKDVTAIGMGPDGALAVGSKGGVTVLDQKGTPIRAMGPNIEARALHVDQRGRLVMAQKALVVQDGTPSPKLLTLTVPRDGQQRVLDEISAIATMSTGEMLVADRGERGVFKFGADGKYVAPFVTGRFTRMALGPADAVALLDRDAKNVMIVDRAGKPVARVATKGTGYELLAPADVAFDALGHLYVLDGAAVHVFSSAGALVASFTSPDKAAPGAFRDASALALDNAARLFIYDDNAERVQVYQ